MKKINKMLLITNSLESNPSGGRELLCKLNHTILLDIYGARLITFELKSQAPHSFLDYLRAFKGHIDGINFDSIRSIENHIINEGVEQVFIDGSNLGECARFLKKKFQYLKVTVFFHNAESRFFWGALCSRKSVKSFFVLVANYLTERKSIIYSDNRICLSGRDSGVLKRLYGRGATHISAMALEDKMKSDVASSSKDNGEIFALFVGGSFYANRVGITWFVNNVVPKIDIPIYIVGRGFELLRSELEVPGKVYVIGPVDDLAPWYNRARFVIAPIFDGSGMKTKVAEALMHGKKVVGTPEAFSGYEDSANVAGWICKSPEDFISACEQARDGIDVVFDQKARNTYLEKYSLAASKKRFQNILNE